MLLKGGCVFDEDGCDMEAVLDLRAGDKDVFRRLGLFGLVVVLTGTRTVDCLVASAAFISTAMTLRFFFDGDTIAKLA